MPEPREGLPPCVSAAVFEGRRVFMRDSRKCHHDMDGRKAIVVVADELDDPCHRDEREWHDGCAAPSGRDPLVLELWTDDEAEAQAAYDEGAAWVLTREMA